MKYYTRKKSKYFLVWRSLLTISNNVLEETTTKILNLLIYAIMPLKIQTLLCQTILSCRIIYLAVSCQYSLTSFIRCNACHWCGLLLTVLIVPGVVVSDMDRTTIHIHNCLSFPGISIRYCIVYFTRNLSQLSKF